jgi:hypothetical protein
MSLFPIFAPVTAAAATVTYTDNKVSDAASTAIRTFNSVDIGTASDDRVVIVSIGTGGGGGGTDDCTSVTVGGTALTKQFSRLHTDHLIAQFWAGTITSGTSATIVVTWARAANASGIGVWATTGLDISGGTTDTGSAVRSSSSADVSADLNISAGGIALAYSVNLAAEDVNPTYSHTNLTTNFNHSYDYARSGGGASAAFAAAQTGLTLTNATNATNQLGVTIFASFPPA